MAKKKRRQQDWSWLMALLGALPQYANLGMNLGMLGPKIEASKTATELKGLQIAQQPDIAATRAADLGIKQSKADWLGQLSGEELDAYYNRNLSGLGGLGNWLTGE
jgi:hypothetical protein